jgi:hypothetical protein
MFRKFASLQFGSSADHWQGIAWFLQQDGRFLPVSLQSIDFDRFSLPFDAKIGQLLPNEVLRDPLKNIPVDQDLPGLSGLHQAGRKVDIVAHHAVGTAGKAAVSPGAHAAFTDPNLDRSDVIVGRYQQVESG